MGHPDLRARRDYKLSSLEELLSLLYEAENIMMWLVWPNFIIDFLHNIPLFRVTEYKFNIKVGIFSEQMFLKK